MEAGKSLQRFDKVITFVDSVSGKLQTDSLRGGGRCLFENAV